MSADDQSESEALNNEETNDPDLPPGSKIEKGGYLLMRAEQIGLLRGFDTAKPESRSKAVKKMELLEREIAVQRPGGEQNQPAAGMWRPLGPAPIPISPTTSYSGRVSAIAVHPTNANIVYVGTAQGGVYRSLNGGTTWTPIMDGAQTLAIGAVTISPSDPTTIFVGTGEAGLCGSGCYIGVGIYRITDAETTPVLSGPLNQGSTGGDVFTGRAISKIVVHPTNPNILFATSTSGVAGIGGTTAGLTLPLAGLYRTTNALGAAPTFERLSVSPSGNVTRSTVDAIIEPGNPNRLIITVIGSGGDGGIYLSTNALDAVPTFTRTLTTGDGNNAGRAELAINKVGGVTTVYAATGVANGTLYKSVDGGATFVQTVSNNFCNPQCFYDIAVAVDPFDADKVYLGGSPSLVFGRSTNGGMSFTNSSTGLHVDTHAFAIPPSEPTTLYFGSDGGIWKTTNLGATPISWTSLNNSTFSATQFESIALHPLDRNYLIGGTQDNGTQFLAPDGATWVRSDGGDGGFAVIDQNSPNINNVTAYHTYFNQTNSQIGFRRATTTDPNGDPIWSTFYGCSGTANGINCADAVLFYAPMVGGPGNPNTLYFGTNRVYRSSNLGVTMTDISGMLPARVSAIGISPQNDNIRLAGTTAGRVYLSTTADATAMTDVTGSIPGRYVGRVRIDPNNSAVAYVALNGYGLAAGQHIWKTTNLTSGTPTWIPAGNGIPDVPVNAFVVDSADSQQLFAGTDIGVFRSTDGGANWIPFSDNLPRVAVFGMELQPIHRVLKIATHGRGVWEYNLRPGFNGNTKFDYDGDGKADVSVFRPDNGVWYLLNSQSGFLSAAFGISTDKIVPADYDGDGKTDLAVYRSGIWFLQRSTAGFTGVAFGDAADIPQPADFDGDGKAELAVFRPSNGTWYVYNLANNQVTSAAFGQNGDKPVVGDYDGDGRADYAVFRPAGGVWYLLRSAAGFTGIAFGADTDKPVPADYDGDGKTDVAVFRPSNGTWYLLQSTAGFTGIAFGLGTDLPVPADYDGDGKADVAVFRNGTWYLQRSTAGFTGVAFGASTDKPSPNAFIQ
ncbi:MAG: VCBS repeat-containing protein [Acidobacteria bacterium]|nr:VCBS repeat-containing protein [Acidobacteriota bacterium]